MEGKGEVYSTAFSLWGIRSSPFLCGHLPGLLAAEGFSASAQYKAPKKESSVFRAVAVGCFSYTDT